MTDPTQDDILIVQIVMLVVQILGLIGLAWYALETRKMRKAAEQQITVSQGLINAAMDQVEGMSKPCLALKTETRDGADTILEAEGAVGSLAVYSGSRFFVLQNIGTGIALNVRYQFLQLTGEENRLRPARRYVQNLLPNGDVTTVEATTNFRGEWQLHLNYESIGGRRYRSVVTIRNLVLVAFDFQPQL